MEPNEIIDALKENEYIHSTDDSQGIADICGITGGGGEQVQADWDQTDTEAPDYIKNKPTVLVVEGSVNDMDYIFTPASGQPTFAQAVEAIKAGRNVLFSVSDGGSETIFPFITYSNEPAGNEFISFDVKAPVDVYPWISTGTYGWVNH